MAGVQLENVSKTFRGPKNETIRAVQNLILSVEEDELLVLLGPSGCGKTTTLRLIAGLEKPDQGRILAVGKEITRLPARERNVSFVFQNPALLPQLTVRENVLLGLKLRRIASAGREASLEKIGKQLQISELLERFPETLSGGQQQRVSLARALITKPDLLLLDEPLSNLDPITRNQLREVIRQLHRERKKPTIYVTHDQSEAFYLGNRIAVLNGGRLEQLATPRTLLSDPATWFVAQFIGNGVNVLKNEDRDRMTAIRPEHVLLHENGKITGVVSDRIDLATHWEIHIKTGEQIIRAVSSHEIGMNGVVHFDLPADKILRFERKTGARI